MVDDGEATWRPPPRIGMVKKFPEEDAVLIGLELFAECSRRRYLALSEGLKMEFAATHTSARTRYRKLWKRLLVHVQTSMALAGALVKRDLIESGQGRGHRMDVATVVLVAMNDSYMRQIDAALDKRMQESLIRSMKGKREKEKVIAQTFLEISNSEGMKADFNPMVVMRSLRKQQHASVKQQFQYNGEEEVSTDHIRLLLLVSLYTSDSNRSAFPGVEVGQELWVRRQQLLVIIYECIRAGALNYDYAPVADSIGSNRIWLNISQEGVDDLDDMTQAGFLVSLKMSSSKYTTSTAYRLTRQGYQHLKTHLRRRDRAAIEEVVYANNAELTPGNLFLPKWSRRKECFYLKNANGDSKRSDVTEIEEVSYVSSPFIPRHMRKWGRGCLSNRDKTDALAKASSTIKDDLDEQLSFDQLRIVVGEWVPMGANQLLSLNDKLGSTEHVSGSYLTSELDTDPDNPFFHGKIDGLTRVNVLDFDETAYVNFEAEINFEVTPGIIQIENFGVHVSEDGFVAYGLVLDGMMNVMDGTGLSLDHLARLLRDIGTDSSDLINNLLTPHQRTLLDLVFLGESVHREKFNVFFTSRINRQGHDEMPMAHELLDMEDMENEIRQIIGEVESGFQLSRDDEMIITGSNGVIVCSKETEKLEPLVMQYISVVSRNMFIQSLYRRTFMTVDMLREIDRLIEEHDANPNNFAKIRQLIATVSADIILMREVQNYLLESLTDPMDLNQDDPVVQRAAKILQLTGTKARIKRRIDDIRKNLEGASSELRALKSAADVIQENRTFKVSEAVSNNTRNLEDVYRANERASTSLEIMQVVLTGSLAFAILDRVHGLYLGVASDIDWSIKAFDWYLQTPGVMFVVNIFWWFVLGVFFNRIIKFAGIKSAGVLAIRYKINHRINLDAMPAFLKETKPEMEDSETDSRTDVKKLTWDERDRIRWKGLPPKIEIVVDMKNGFLLTAFIQIATRLSKCKHAEAKKQLFARLREMNLISGHVHGLETAKEAEYVYRRPFLSPTQKFMHWFKTATEDVRHFFTF